MGLDLVLKLERCQSLVVKNLTDLSAVELEVRMSEMAERNTSDEEQHIRVITLTLRFERIISKLVAVRFIVNVILLFPGVSVRIR